MMILMREFWSGVNVGGITMFFAYMALGRLATLLMAVYVGVLAYRWYKTRPSSTRPFIVPTDLEDPDDMTGEFEPLDDLTDFKTVD